jgi:hypothetical protein
VCFGFINTLRAVCANCTEPKCSAGELIKTSFILAVNMIFENRYDGEDRLCVLVVRAPGYRSRGPGFDSRRYQIVMLFCYASTVLVSSGCATTF